MESFRVYWCATSMPFLIIIGESMRKLAKSLLDQRFGRLLVIKRAPCNPNNTRAQWLCRCDCGVEKIFSTNDLRNGNITSCYRDCELHCLWKKQLDNGLKQLKIKNYYAIELDGWGV